MSGVVYRGSSDLPVVVWFIRDVVDYQGCGGLSGVW